MAKKRTRDPDPDDDSQEAPSRPPPYDIEEAFQEAFTQDQIPAHTDDLEAEYARIRERQQDRSDRTEQPPATEPAATDLATSDGTSDALATEDQSGAISVGGARASPKLPPLTLAEKLQHLRPWMRSYVTALMNLGGNDTLACQRVRVALHSCRDYQLLVPEFGAAVQEAKEFATGLVKASLFQSASIGDLEAVYRGPYLVGWKRVKSVKAAELLLEMSGDLGDRGRSGGNVTVRGNAVVVVGQAAREQLPDRVAETVAKLIQANRGRPVENGVITPET